MTDFSTFRAGDIYLLSPETYQAMKASLLSDSMLKGSLSIIRLDGASGNSAVRPLMNTDLRTGLANTGIVLSRCQSEKIRSLGDLCSLYADILRTLEYNDSVGAYDDIIMALQPQRLIHIKQQLIEHDHALREAWEERLNELCAQVPRCDEYGYLLNVAAHNVIRRWARFGGADNKTDIQSDIDMTKVNIIVDYESVPADSIMETGEDPMLPVMEHWLSTLQPYMEESEIHLDPLLIDRYKRLNSQGFSVSSLKQQTAA